MYLRCALALRGLDLLFFPTGSIEWKSYNDRGSVEKPRLDAEGFEIDAVDSCLTNT